MAMPELIDKKVVRRLIKYLDKSLSKYDYELSLDEKWDNEEGVHDAAQCYYEAKRVILLAMNVESKKRGYYYDFDVNEDNKHYPIKKEL